MLEHKFKTIETELEVVAEVPRDHLIFNNYLILKQIFSFLDTQDVTNNCSLVTKQWHTVASIIPKYKIRLYEECEEIGIGSKSFCALLKEEYGTLVPSKTHDLSLNQIKSKLRLIPRKRIWLHLVVSHIAHEEVKNFLKLLGNSVTHLIIGQPHLHPFIQVSSQEFWSLFHQLPNLESLTFQNEIPVSWNWFTGNEIYIDSPPIGIKLDKLKVLAFKESFSSCSFLVLTQLVELSSNLEKLYNIPFDALGERVLDTRSRLRSFTYSVTQLHWNYELTSFTADQYMNSLEGLISCQEQLKIFVFFPTTDSSYSSLMPIILQRCRQAFTKILESSQDTLKKLKIEPLESLNFLNFPPLKNVTSLGFFSYPSHILKTVKGQKIRAFFPPQYKSLETFPNLSTVEISIVLNALEGDTANEMKEFQEYFPKNIFHYGVGPQSSTFKSVQYLKLSQYFPKSCMTCLAQLFSNITNLKLNLCQPDMCKILPVVFMLWPKLSKLSLDFTKIFEGACGNLDTALTGIPEDKFQSLDLSISSRKAMRKMYQKQSSICDMKELRILRLILPVWMTPWFSHISGFYAFEMSQFTISVIVKNVQASGEMKDVRNKLQPILQYVTQVY